MPSHIHGVSLIMHNLDCHYFLKPFSKVYQADVFMHICLFCPKLFISLLSYSCSECNDRLLALGTCFSTKMIRKYGMVQLKKDACELQDASESRMCSPPVGLSNREQTEMENSRKLHEMAHFLEIIRNLQRRLSAKFKMPGQVLVWFCLVLRILASPNCSDVITRRKLTFLPYFLGGWW